jgi:SIR2-like domain
MSNNIPESLKIAFANKTLIPLVGAGVSMSLKNKAGEKLFPSWPELLERAASKLEAEKKSDYADAIRSMLKLKKYKEAADCAREGLVGGLWNQFFTDVFNINSKEIDEDSLALPKAIWSLSDRVVTLNYDKILRIACPLPHDVHQLDSTNKVVLADFCRNSFDKPAIWHLHGKIDNLEKIILTSDSYDRFYVECDPDYKAALATFQSLCRATTLLFVGCSLDDAELLQQIESQYQIFAGNIGPHFALVHKAQLEAIGAKLRGLPIDLISFEEFGKPLLDIISAISAPTHDATEVNIKVSQVAPIISATTSSNNRIAILTADPIGENCDYKSLTKEFEKLNCEITYYPLTIKALNDLEGFDYIFILSRLIKNNIVIEDDALQSARSNFKNIENNIGNGNTKGIFVFLHQASRETLSSPDISNDLESLQLPTIIFPAIEKSQLSSFRFQCFKKCNIDYIPDVVITNREKFQLCELKGNNKIHKGASRLSESIDKKIAEQYLGRRTDLQYLCREIVALQSVNEFLTIKGPGGSGKTATVKKIAVELSERGLFSEGIDFVDCEFVGDYSSFEKKVAACFNLENALDIPQEIKSKVEKQDKLIVLDNLETALHLPDTQQIKDFIYFVCEYASFVITTREILDLGCEKVIELNRYSSDDAYALFIKHLRREPIDAVERRVIRHEIVEELLDNNPLAIKLVASNLPTSKKMQDLKRELEEDFFRKASADELSELDALSDINIERKKSLYASINFSYKNLDEAEKKGFEILSLFPDGIHMNLLKIIAGERKNEQRRSSKRLQKQHTDVPVITDLIIRNLENKSIIQVDNQIIKLQSIMGKFAERQLHRRKANELSNYYQRASELHISIAEYLYHLRPTERSARAANMFYQQQSNFFKSISYLHEANVTAEKLLIYLKNVGDLAIDTTSAEFFSAVLSKAEAVKAQLTGVDEKLYFDLILLKSQYYAGNFSEVFSRLKQLMPLNVLKKFQPLSSIEKSIGGIPIRIYGMEGEEFLELEYDIKNSVDYYGYSQPLFQLGELNITLLEKCKTGCSTLESKLALGILDNEEVDKYIRSAYEKDHLELMELHYIKTKLNFKNKKIIDVQNINSLVIVNPYTLGLQQLMLAFASDIPTEAIALYEQALNNLAHIKYFYVEALLHYARYLQQQNLQSEFNKIHHMGYELACRHYYRWLRYQFEDLIEKKTGDYKSSDYPLPKELDIDGYIQWLIKQK